MELVKLIAIYSNIKLTKLLEVYFLKIDIWKLKWLNEFQGHYWTSFENYVVRKQVYYELTISGDEVHKIFWKMDPSFNNRLKILHESNGISFVKTFSNIPFGLNTRYMVVKYDSQLCKAIDYYDNYYIAYGKMILNKDWKSSFKVIDLEELKPNLDYLYWIFSGFI